MENKNCIKCKELKPLDKFQGVRNVCRQCRWKQRKSNNKTYEVSVTEKECFKCKIIKSASEFYIGNKHATGLMTNCKVCQKERVNGQYGARAEKIKKTVKEYQQNNKEQRRITRRKTYRKRFDSDPKYRLTRRLRCRLRDALRKKYWKKNTHFSEYIGCDLDFLKLHIEKKFTKGMDWNNQGKWELDHIIPLSSAKTEQELYQLCHYTNIQPLWAEDNNAKSDKIL